MPTIDYAIFNELSAAPHARNLTEATRWLFGIVDVMKRAARLRFRRLRTRHDFRQLELMVDTRLDHVISHLDRDRRMLFLQVLDSPYLDESLEAKFLSHDVLSVAGATCRNAEGLLCAYIIDALAISFESDPQWHGSQLVLGLATDLNPRPGSVTVRHACHKDHIASHIAWASRRTCSEQELMPSMDRPLPNTRFSDQLVSDDWSEFYRDTSSLGASSKTAKLREVASEVAFINGYDHSSKLSAENRKDAGALRHVFVSAFTRPGHEIYLSTDFEKAAGAFEVCDFKGRHLGEWLFSGKRNGEADASGGHDILV
jgi:hypothetical protein